MPERHVDPAPGGWRLVRRGRGHPAPAGVSTLDPAPAGATPPTTANRCAPGEESGKRLVVDRLTVEFGGVRALEGVSLEAGQGEVVGVIGPNGAGKTTLFNVICGLTRPRAGGLSYGGTTLGRHRPHDLNRLGIARTLQAVGLCGGMTALENVVLGAQSNVRAGIVSALLGTRRSSREERRLSLEASEMLERLGIGRYAGRSAATLPYAVQKRVALARALNAGPTLLLLDEPASGLADEELGELGRLIAGLAPRIGVLLVEHRMDLVNAVCQRVVVLNFGRVIATGTPAAIRADPEVTTAYLGRDVGTPAPPDGSRTEGSTTTSAEPAPSRGGGAPVIGARDRRATKGAPDA
jgi:branched-chain amino acid transport system ATP-binding protein